MKSGIELIAIERQEQIEKHGFTIGGDVNCNRVNQLNQAAVSLIIPDEKRSGISESLNAPPPGWYAFKWVKMINKPYKERLIIAGALIAAEIDRIQYNEINPLEHENMK